MDTNMPSATAAEALAATLAVPFEGFVPHPYQDSVGVWTIGYGSTRDDDQRPVSHSTPNVTEAQGRALLSRDMGDAVREVAKDVKVPLSLNEWAALGDFIYNLGGGTFRSSTLLRKLNAGDYAGAAAEIDRFDHAGGRVMSGLLRRREAETKLFETA